MKYLFVYTSQNSTLVPTYYQRYFTALTYSAGDTVLYVGVTRCSSFNSSYNFFVSLGNNTFVCVTECEDGYVGQPIGIDGY